ncbi:MAG: hypothetical protein NVSMB14_15580 [Isosphaeraceae bacterium]
MITRKQARILLAMAAAVGLAGCAVRPRFMTMGHAAPIVRARSASQGEELPEQTVVPALIARLSDPDPVVRLSAHHAPTKRTGKDFGFVPWADEAERAKAIARWRKWWTESGVPAPAARSPRIN